MINNASVPSTATILDGTSLRTMGLSSDVRLKGGEHLTLASGSAATIFQDRLVLQNGTAEVTRQSTYFVEAGSLRIGASSSDATFRVAVSGTGLVQVAPSLGTAEVRNAKGILLARVLPGTALQLRTAPGNNVSRLTGLVTTKDGKFFLTDQATGVNVELHGDNLASLVGKTVRVEGLTTAAVTEGTAALVTVSSSTVVAAGAAAAGGATAAGVSLTTVAAIGGVAAAATLGGLAAAGTFSNDTPVSR